MNNKKIYKVQKRMSCSRRGKEAEYIFKIQRLSVGSKAESNKKKNVSRLNFYAAGVTYINHLYIPA